MIPYRFSDVPEVLEVQVVPSDEVRMVPELPTATNVLFPYKIFHIPCDDPEVLEVQVVPSDDVSMTPDIPTAINNPLDVVLLLSLFLAQEMTVRLIIDMRIICIILFIFSFHH